MVGEEGFGGNVLEVASVGGRLPLAGTDGVLADQVAEKWTVLPHHLPVLLLLHIHSYLLLKPSPIQGTSGKDGKERRNIKFRIRSLWGRIPARWP